MNEPVTIQLQRRPSALATLYRGMRSGKHRAGIGKRLPPATAGWFGVTLSGRYLDRFSKICGLENTGFLPVLYPFTLIYPLNLRLISHREIVVPMFKMAHVTSSKPHVTNSARRPASDVTRDMIQPTGVLSKYENESSCKWLNSLRRMS